MEDKRGSMEDGHYCFLDKTVTSMEIKEESPLEGETEIPRPPSISPTLPSNSVVKSSLPASSGRRPASPTWSRGVVASGEAQQVEMIRLIQMMGKL